MAGSRELRRVNDSVVRFGRAVERPCARPSCSTPARATLTFRYATREAWIERLTDDTSPQAYDLCTSHAARTQPPSGWQLRDRRPEDERRPDVPVPTPVDLGGDRTVAVLAAALRAVPDVVSEDDLRVPAAEADLAGQMPPTVVPVEEAASPLLERSRHVEQIVAEPPASPPSPGPLELDLGFPVLHVDGPSDPQPTDPPVLAGSFDVPTLFEPHASPADGPASVPRPPLAVRPRRGDPPSAAGNVAADW